MEDVDKFVKWRLVRGSNQFPTELGETCILEVAILAFGFSYQPVLMIDDIPACFSRPLCQFAMQLNDRVSKTSRQRLLPFAFHLACADTPAIERERETHIRSRLSLFERYSGYISIDKGIELMNGALSIGRRAEIPDLNDIIRRLSAATNSASRTAKSDSYFSQAGCLMF